MSLNSYKELLVWQRSIELVVGIYTITGELPKEELYGISSQMRRAVVSIPSNIAEGYKRRHLGEYLHFLSIADASAAELDTQLIIMKKIYPGIQIEQEEQLLVEVQKMLYSLIEKLSPKP